MSLTYEPASEPLHIYVKSLNPPQASEGSPERVSSSESRTSAEFAYEP